MHKQKLYSALRRSKWLGFLLLFLLTMATQMFPFLAPHVWAEGDGEHNISASAVTITWLDSTTMSVKGKSGVKFPGTNIPVSGVVDGSYILRGGIVQETNPFDKDAGAIWHPYIANGMSNPAYQCEHNGVISPVNSYVKDSDMKANNDTMRIDTNAPGSSSVLMRIRFNPKGSEHKSYCYTQDIMIKTSNRASGAIIGAWLDSANIKINVVEPGTYKINTQNTKHFVSQESGQGASCKDVLVITGDDNSLGTPVTIYNQQSKDHAKLEGKGVSPIDSSCGIDSQVSGYISNPNQAKTAPAGSGLGNPIETEPSCESSGSTVLNWVFCAVIDAVDGALSSVNGIVDNMLSMDTAQIQGNEKLHTLWSYFRNIASLLLVVVALVMIIAQSLGNS